MNKINIIVTVGPASFNERAIKKMDASGVDFFRINLSHTNASDFASIVNKLQSWTNKPICPDTEGAQIRTSLLCNKIKTKSHDTIEFINKKDHENENHIGITGGKIQNIFRIGDLIKIDFDGVIVQIINVSNNCAQGRLINGGIIGNNKGLSSDRIIKIPSFSSKDEQIIKMSANLGLKHIFLSFCSSHLDIINLREKFKYDT